MTTQNLGRKMWTPGKRIGEFRTPDRKEFLGSVYKVSATEWIIGRCKMNSEQFEFVSAPFKPSDFRVLGSWGGVVEYTAK